MSANLQTYMHSRNETLSQQTFLDMILLLLVILRNISYAQIKIKNQNIFTGIII